MLAIIVTQPLQIKYPTNKRIYGIHIKTFHQDNLITCVLKLATLYIPIVLGTQRAILHKI